jgi:hypothetical protein
LIHNTDDIYRVYDVSLPYQTFIGGSNNPIYLQYNVVKVYKEPSDENSGGYKRKKQF